MTETVPPARNKEAERAALRVTESSGSRTAGSLKRGAIGLAVTTLLTGAALLVGLVIEHLLRLPNIMLVFLPVVLFAAVRFGLVAASWASFLSVIATSFFLAPPTMSFAVSDPSNVWALLIFLAVAIVTSSLALEREHLTQKMHEAEMLAATEKLRAALLMSISHDLKTPLGSILGNVTSLRQYGHLFDDGIRLETLTAIEDETRRLCLFVDNLLHMTRIDAGALKPTIEPVDVSDLIGSALKRVARQLKSHHLRTALAPDLPMILLDFVLAEQVLVNVFENAGKFAPSGTEIVVSAVQRKDEVVIRVEDQGPGIPEQDLPKVFERFFRAPVGDHRPAGVGLGLSVCKGFVEAMGGTVTAENREGAKGVAITIRFPNVAVERAI
ncbi:MAG TPA: ATP-binding protein [Woeseiaceae bacterium]